MDATIALFTAAITAFTLASFVALGVALVWRALGWSPINIIINNHFRSRDDD